MYENENDFSDLEEEVVDMTNPNRKKNSTYGGGYLPEDTYREHDSYGAYSIKNDRLRGSSIDSGRRGLNLFLDVLYIIALIASVGSIGYTVKAHIIDSKEFFRLELFVLIYIEVVFIINALVLFSRHRNPALLITGIFLPIFFPFVRAGVTGRFKLISYLWIGALCAVAFLFYRNNYQPMRYGYEEIKSYSGEYNSVVGKFKDEKGDYGVKSIEVIRDFFSEYEIKLVEDKSQTAIFKIEGTLKKNVDFSGSVGGEIPGKSKKEMSISYEIVRVDGKYTLTDMQINGVSAKNNMDNIWKAMCEKAK